LRDIGNGRGIIGVIKFKIRLPLDELGEPWWDPEEVPEDDDSDDDDGNDGGGGGNGGEIEITSTGGGRVARSISPIIAGVATGPAVTAQPTPTTTPMPAPTTGVFPDSDEYSDSDSSDVAILVDIGGDRSTRNALASGISSA
jgi:hypothetical protein